MIPIIHLYNILIVMTLGIPTCWKGIYGLKAAQACSLQTTFASWLVFYIPCQAEPRVLLANSGRHLHSLNEFGEKHLHYHLIHSTFHSCLCKTKVILLFQGVLLQRSFLCNSCGQSHTTLFLELRDYITLDHFLWGFFPWKDLLVSHMAQNFPASSLLIPRFFPFQ